MLMLFYVIYFLTLNYVHILSVKLFIINCYFTVYKMYIYVEMYIINFNVLN